MNTGAPPFFMPDRHRNTASEDRGRQGMSDMP